MENINLELYKIFYFVAKEKNITKASNTLLISQPAITQAIHKLEQQMEYKLFYRTSRGVELTEEGLKLYELIKEPIQILNRCKSLIQNNGFDNTLKIGGGITLLKHNAINGIKKFKEKYPNINIDISRGITSELINDLENGLIDLVLFNMPTNYSENICFEIIEEVNDVFVANSNDFSYLNNKKIKINELQDIPLVLQSRVSSSGKHLNSILNKNKVVIQNSYELESYDLVLEFVKAGVGIGFVNKKHVLNELKNKKLFILDIDYDIPSRNIAVAYHKRNYNNPLIKNFIKFIK